MAVSTLGYALLGMLAREPRSGYDLGRELKKPIGFFWHARYSQIYPELAKLEGRGYIKHEVIEQQDLPDKKSTRLHQSLQHYVLEEVYEVVEALEEEDPVHLAEELGDLLLQVYLHTEVARQAGEFSIADVFEQINAKLIRRHPHVFGDVQVSEAAQVTNFALIWADESRSFVVHGAPSHCVCSL